jgi:hypothetical protein
LATVGGKYPTDRRSNASSIFASLGTPAISIVTVFGRLFGKSDLEETVLARRKHNRCSHRDVRYTWVVATTIKGKRGYALLTPNRDLLIVIRDYFEVELAPRWEHLEFTRPLAGLHTKRCSPLLHAPREHVPNRDEPKPSNWSVGGTIYEPAFQSWRAVES